MRDLNDLYYFVAVVDHGGFAAAGRALGLQKSKLSRRILQVEERSFKPRSRGAFSFKQAGAFSFKPAAARHRTASAASLLCLVGSLVAAVAFALLHNGFGFRAPVS
jgi:regulatory helix-turn-helix LysR family protein